MVLQHYADPEVYGEREQHVLEYVSSQVARAIDRKRAEERLRARERQQAAVAELGQRALVAAELPDLLQAAAALVAQTLDVELSAVLELLPGGAEFVVRAHHGWSDGLVRDLRVPAGDDSQSGYTLLSREPVVLDDARTETRFKVSGTCQEHGVAWQYAPLHYFLNAAGRDSPPAARPEP